MKPAIGLLLAGALALAAVTAAPAGATPYIEVHVSVKVIRDPASGLRPPIDDVDPAQKVTDSLIEEMFFRANAQLQDTYWRGYRFVLDEIQDIGTPCTVCPTGNPSTWYSTTFADGTTPTLKDLENAAKASPAAFLWRTQAINLYFNLGKGDGAVSSFPPDEVVAAGGRVFDPSYVATFAASIFVHELGHYFNLAHPNAKLADCCNPATCILDGDGLGDTLPDGPCFTQDQLSQFNFGLPYASLDDQQRGMIDDIWTNNMSYLHPGQPYGFTFMDRLTEGQLDRWTDTANSTRAGVRSGRTWFVSTAGSVSGSGASGNPFRNVTQGIAASNAAGGDIVLVRPGTYNAGAVIDKRLTLRATRRGAVTLLP